MNFGRMNSGAMAGFLAAGISGPIYGVTVLIVGAGDVFDVDLGFGPELVVGLPFAILFGCVFAGLPGILFGMAMGAWIGDRPTAPSIQGAAAALGAVIGVALLQAVNDAGMTTSVVLRGGIVGALTATAWLMVFDALRRRSPTVVSDGADPHS